MIVNGIFRWSENEKADKGGANDSWAMNIWKRNERGRESLYRREKEGEVTVGGGGCWVMFLPAIGSNIAVIWKYMTGRFGYNSLWVM